MKIEFNLTKHDYIDFNMYYIENSPTVKKSLFIQRYILSLIFIVVPFVLAAISDIPLIIWMVVYGLVFIIWIVFYPRYFMTSTKKRILKMIEEGQNSHLFGFRSITLTESGVEESGEGQESNVLWNSIEKVIETKDYIYIFIGTMNAYIVPIRAFDNDDHKNEFLEIIRNNKK